MGFLDSLEIFDSAEFLNSLEFLDRVWYGLVWFGLVWFFRGGMFGNVLEYSRMF